jgi:hypothetical protein
MTDTRLIQHHRGKLQPTEAFNFQGSHDPLKPGLPQEPGFLIGSCCSSRFTQMGADGRSFEASRTRCHLGCARAQALACLVCMCAPARSADGAGMQRFSRGCLAWVACGHSRDDIASLAQWRRAPAYEAGGRRFDPFTRRHLHRRSISHHGRLAELVDCTWL